MPSYRQKMAVYKKEVSKEIFDPFVKARKTNHEETRAYILKAILMHEKVVSSLEPLTDEEKLCREEILKYKIDLELLDRGTYEERKEVVKKYGGIIG